MMLSCEKRNQIAEAKDHASLIQASRPTKAFAKSEEASSYARAGSERDLDSCEKQYQLGHLRRHPSESKLCGKANRSLNAGIAMAWYKLKYGYGIGDFVGGDHDFVDGTFVGKISKTFFTNFVTTKAQFDQGVLNYTCSLSQTTPNNAFHLNLRTLLSYLFSNATAKKQFYNTIVSSRNHFDTIYGMFFCWVTSPFNFVPSASQMGYRDCMIHFSNRSFFSMADLSPLLFSCTPFDVSN
ncbi:cysteine-rich receptor protein kinase 23 [Spatholobus suberectus]|nr:cysteine-rich receptor protein kinase 23 [Spatholobus suberectus]